MFSKKYIYIYILLNIYIERENSTVLSIQLNEFSYIEHTSANSIQSKKQSIWKKLLGLSVSKETSVKGVWKILSHMS